MPIRRALCALLLGGLAAVAAHCWAQSSAGDAADTYIIKRGDTLIGIARRLGITTEAIQQANELSHPDHLAAGNVLRLPAAARPPAPHKTAAAADAVLPAPTDRQAVTARTPSETAPAVVAPALVPAPPAAAPQPTAPPAKAAPTPVAPVPAAPTPAAPPQARAPGVPVDTDQLAVGMYRHPTLGTLRVSKGSDGVILNKDNKIIPMRRLLYAIYDGTDAAGNVHNIDLVFDDAGHVSALRYSSGGTGQITFEKVNK